MKSCLQSYFFNLLITQLWKRFRGSDKPPAELGASRDYNVDMIPKVCIIYTAVCPLNPLELLVC